MYYGSVGHNSTLILGLTPDDRGLIPDADAARLKEWGDEIENRFSKPIKSISGNQTVINMVLDKKQAVNHIILQEEITSGERVRSYKIEAEIDKKWQIVAEGECIGHKHIQKFEAITTSKLRLTIKESIAPPLIKNFSVFFVN